MQRFVGSKSSKAEWILSVVVYGIMVGSGFFGLYDAWKHHSPPTYYATLIFAIILCGVMAVFSVPYVLKTFAVYEVDAAELIQREVFRSRRMRWRDVAKVRERAGMHESSITLTDNGGEQMTISLNLLEHRGDGLRAL